MQIDWWTLALQTINLLVLVWILGRFLFRPIAKTIEERQAAAARVVEDARLAREQAEAAEQQARREAAAAATARGAMLEEAAEQAKQEKERLLAEARDEAARLRQQGRAEIERMRKTEAEKFGSKASELAVDIARHLFMRLPDSARIDGFVEGLAKAIADLPDNVRAELGAHGAPVALKAARSLTPEEETSCRRAIVDALGRDIGIDIQIDPELIAGLEIEAPHAEVRNNFRADLDRIAQELSREGSDA
ncbi:MAG: ATPase [Novosphingobium sp.]|nr:ATPase [Novosphingobium sp.]MCP5403469.1 ATPase [Novosphingobium sp.]